MSRNSSTPGFTSPQITKINSQYCHSHIYFEDFRSSAWAFQHTHVCAIPIPVYVPCLQSVVPYAIYKLNLLSQVPAVSYSTCRRSSRIDCIWTSQETLKLLSTEMTPHYNQVFQLDSACFLPAGMTPWGSEFQPIDTEAKKMIGGWEGIHFSVGFCPLPITCQCLCGKSRSHSQSQQTVISNPARATTLISQTSSYF
jgi:hypothetical protein